MKKRMISSVALGLVGTTLFPIIAGATGQVETTVNEETANESKNENNSNDNNTSSDKVEIPNSDKVEISNRDWEKEFPRLINPKKDEIKTINYSAETMLALKDLISKVDELEKTHGKNTSENYMEVFKALFELHNNIPSEDRKLFAQNDQFSYIFYKLNYLVFTEYYDNNEVFNQFYQDLSDIAYYYTVEWYNNLADRAFIHFIFKYLYDMTPEDEDYFKDTKTNAVVQIAYGNIYFLATGAQGRPNSPTDPSDDFPYEKPSEAYNPNQPSIPPSYSPDDPDEELPAPPEVPDYGIDDNGGNNNNGETNNPNSPNNVTYTESEYVNKNGLCYYIETIKDSLGNTVKTNETKLSSEEGFYCGIIDGLDFTDVPWNSDSEVYYGEKALDVWNSLAENELNELSNLTLHFSLNKSDTNPYYYDSGIKVSNDGTVSYTQLRDVLNQIAIKSGGYLIEDKNKLLFISEGKPLVVRDKESEYTQEEVDNLLNSFKELDLTIKERSGDSISIDEELINNEEAQNITINGEKIELSAKPRLESSILQLPVKEVAEALGYKVDITDEKATLTKDSTIIEIQIGTKNVKINDREKVTSTSSSIVDGTLFAEMNIIAQESGLKIYFDKTKGNIEIK